MYYTSPIGREPTARVYKGSDYATNLLPLQGNDVILGENMDINMQLLKCSYKTLLSCFFGSDGNMQAVEQGPDLVGGLYQHIRKVFASLIHVYFGQFCIY